LIPYIIHHIALSLHGPLWLLFHYSNKSFQSAEIAPKNNLSEDTPSLLVLSYLLRTSRQLWRATSKGVNYNNYRKLLTAAARSICPTACPPAGFGAAPPGLAAVGMGGLPPAGLATGGFGGMPGFAAIGGGFGLFATGGGGLPPPTELEGLELGGVLSDEPLVAPGAFFHGVADPLDGAIPGKTDTGLADESAATDLIGTLATEVGAGVGFGAVGVPADVVGGGRRFGGGGGATAALGFGGTSSR
jgi:hypothetical protein